MVAGGSQCVPLDRSMMCLQMVWGCEAKIALQGTWKPPQKTEVGFGPSDKERLR